jgi:outer membrane receptor protein involved in Fe transport
LLDGVPFNDPFAGWIPWIDAPREGLARLEVVPGGGSTAWGDGALGGVIQLLTDAPSGALVTRPGAALGDGPPDPDLKKPAVVGTAEMSALFGSFDTRDYEFVAAQPTDQGVLQVLGNVFATDGYPIVARQSRGPVDISAWNRHDWFEARWRQPLGKTLVLTTTVRTHEESSGDGTPFQQGSSSGRFASVSVAGQPSALVAWSATSYLQEGQAAQTLSLVNSNRTAETPVLDNTGVPETAAGASWNGVWRGSGESTTTAGADLRLVRAETRNEYAFQDGAFSRSLVSGGEQGDIGVYFLRDQGVVNALRATLGVRIDTWREAGGYQVDTGLPSEAALGTEHFPAETGTEFCPSAGLVWAPATPLRLRLNGQRAFSRPTLADLFQPTGEYSIVTEANPLLSTERCTSLEAGAEYVLRLERADPDPRPDPSGNRLPHPSGTITLGATFFSNELRDAIGADALAPNSTAVPIFGPLPAGYIGEQRINIDRSRIEGAAFSLEWTLAPSVSLDASLLCNDPIIVRAARAAIDGNQIAGIARRSAAINAKWIFSEKVTLRSRLRVLGPEFEDDENTIRLGRAVILDVAAAYALTKHIEFSLSAVNLGDARVQASRSLNGVEYVSHPRMVQSGLRFAW